MTGGEQPSAVIAKSPGAGTPALPVVTFAPAVARAAPSVVNVYTAKHVEVPAVPLPSDPGWINCCANCPGSRGVNLRPAWGRGSSRGPMATF
ncbi:hypothetical protein CDEF62S_02596 [Castellaniella defragrans]